MSKVNILKRNDPRYPSSLKHISNAPKQLFWEGQDPADWGARPKVAIVGSRKATSYGLGVTRDFAGGLSRLGVVIISGLAYGIDAAAHRGALEAGGTTVAILPTSLDNIYPAAHQNLAKRIKENGCLITEYAPNSEVYKTNFVARNRIVAGVADIVLITEAALKSGSLHTARFALEQGKTVMAVPGNINSPSSEGCNNLIKSGAIPVTTPDDIFFALNIRLEDKKVKISFKGSAEEEKVYGLIEQGISSQEELAEAAGLDAPAISSILTMLELSGYIRPVGGGNWIRT